MILTEEEVTSRIESPLNLLNRLRTATKSRSVIMPNQNDNNGSNGNNNADPMSVFLPPKIGDLVEDIEDKIAMTNSKSDALKVMQSAIKDLKDRISEVDKPKDLARIATDMSKVVGTISDIRGEKADKKQLVIWQPLIVQENHYETIHVTD